MSNTERKYTVYKIIMIDEEKCELLLLKYVYYKIEIILN